MTTEPLVFNPGDPGYLADPYPFYRRLRNEAPVYWWERGHMWLVSRYADVDAVLKDPRFTADARKWRFHRDRMSDLLPPQVTSYLEHRLFYMPPADHARVRKVVAGSFTPRAAARHEGLVQELADELLSHVDAHDGFDFVADFAEHLPVRVISRLLGIPSEHEATFRDWSQGMVQITIPVHSPEQYAAIAQRLLPGFDLLGQVIDDHRRRPQDDLLSSLVEAQEQGNRLSPEELLGLVGGMVTGGSETTTHLLVFAMLELLRHPDVMSRVLEDLELLPGVLEESLRHDNFGAVGVPRYALEDIELRGKTMVKGDMVMCMTGAAMHDEEVWPDAERFDIDRDSAFNLSFGRGAHFCLGAHLARTQARVALKTVLTRFPVLELASEPKLRPHPFLRMMQSLPVRAKGAKT